jgi:hypothetical protein
MDWSIILISVLVPLTIGFGGIMLGNYLTIRSQIKYTKLQSRIDEKKKWINDLRLETAEFIEKWAEYQYQPSLILTHIENKNITDLEWRKMTDDLTKSWAYLTSSKFKITCLLNPLNPKHLELEAKLRGLMVEKIMKEKKNTESDESKVADLIHEITTAINHIIILETENLNRIEKEIN